MIEKVFRMEFIDILKLAWIIWSGVKFEKVLWVCKHVCHWHLNSTSNAFWKRWRRVVCRVSCVVCRGSTRSRDDTKENEGVSAFQLSSKYFFFVAIDIDINTLILHFVRWILNIGRICVWRLCSHGRQISFAFDIILVYSAVEFLVELLSGKGFVKSYWRRVFFAASCSAACIEIPFPSESL